jgi:hypothetical protein
VIAEEDDLRADFDVCVGRLENRDLIRRLSFGDYVLLQPELLDAYASALVIAAKDEPDGLGSIAEERALSGQFHVPEEQRIGDRKPKEPDAVAGSGVWDRATGFDQIGRSTTQFVKLVKETSPKRP